VLNTVLKGRGQLSGLSSILSASLAEKYIRNERGGSIDITRGTRLVVPPQAMVMEKKGVVISADTIKRKEYVCFDFRPDGTVFAENKPAELRAARETLNRYGVDDLTLYGPDDEEIQPDVNTRGVVWRIPHFSLYYFRRR
jgi:hypothetical protein